MKRFVFLTVLCCLVLGMRAQTAKEEIFADVHRSAANYLPIPNRLWSRQLLLQVINPFI